MFNKMRDWRLDRVQACHDQAKHLVNKHVKLLTSEKSEDTIPELQKLKKEIVKAMGTEPEDTFWLHFVNWCSTSSIPKQVMTAQTAVLSWSLCENSNSAGVVMMPTWSQKRGMLWQHEKLATDML